jgi:hypothetical protein
LKVLDHIGCVLKAGPAADVPVVDSTDERGASVGPTNIASDTARKRRRVSKSKIRKTFYGAPSKVNNHPPASSKAPKTIPFVGMVRKSWCKKYDSDNTMQLRDNFDWWNEFEEKIEGGDISADDLAYLAEIEDDSGSEDDQDLAM